MKHLTLKNILFVILTIALASCNKSDDPDVEPEITINGNDPVISWDARISELSFTTNMDWTAEVETAAASWCTITTASGSAGTSIILFTTQKNESASNRTAYLNIKVGKKIQRVLITQWKKNTVTANDGAVLILQQASVGKGVDLVFMGDGFVDRDMETDGKYEQIMKNAMEHFFSIEPNKSYRNYFNVYAVKAVSEDEIFNNTSNTAFEVQFGEGTYVEGNDLRCVEYAKKAPLRSIYNTLITIVVNSERYAGTCYMYYNGTAIAYVPLQSGDEDFQRTILHESAGHGFGKLGDEYIELGTKVPTDVKWVNSFNSLYQSYGWNSNVDITNNATKVRWTHFLQHPTYSSYTRIVEGGYLFDKGVWRAEINSCMRYNDLYFNAPSREAIVKQIKRIAGEAYSFTDFVAKDKYEPEVHRNRLKVAQEYQHTPPVVIDGDFRIGNR